MAKKSMVLRDVKRRKIAERYATRRAELKRLLADPKSSAETREQAQAAFQALPRDASPCRQRRRCGLTGRSRGCYRKFDLGRNKLREAAMRGDIPGLVKASW